jgi:hypothetical protein
MSQIVGWAAAGTVAAALVACGGRTPLELPGIAGYVGVNTTVGSSSTSTATAGLTSYFTNGTWITETVGTVTYNTTTSFGTPTYSTTNDGTGGFPGTTTYTGSNGYVTTIGGYFTSSCGATSTLGNTASFCSIGFVTTSIGVNAGTTSTSTTGTCAALPSNDDLIDDMESGGPNIPQTNGRTGAWTDFGDNSAGAMIWPPTASNFKMSESGDPCRRLAARFYGSGFGIWGTGMKVSLGSPYNATADKAIGITFWAKAGAGSTPNVHVTFPDKDTDPTYGLCDPSTTAANGCYDDFGARLALSSNWGQYTILFAQLTQDGWGRIASQFDPSTLYSIQFLVAAGATFDIWVDDIAFVR